MAKQVNVPEGYHCPFCLNHIDDVFYTSPVVDVPICEGCSTELFIYQHFDKRPKDALINKLEQYTGRSWEECKAILVAASEAYKARARNKPGSR